MPVRDIIEIDREKCDGCGLCTKACAEGALELDEQGKAVLVQDIYCDGMGACLDVCPVAALKIVRKECPDYDEQATHAHAAKTRGDTQVNSVHQATPTHSLAHQGCPGSMAREIERPSQPADRVRPMKPAESELSQWPIQLHLISPYAPYFRECDLLIAADCTAFALGGFHSDLLKGKKLVIACPKLDETAGYVEKLSELLKHNTIYSLTVAIMEVPCCGGLYRLVEQAVAASGVGIRIKKIVVGINGEIRWSPA